MTELHASWHCNGQRQTISTEGPRHVKAQGALHAFIYRDEAGGVTKHTLALVAGGRGGGFRRMQGLKMRTSGGQSFVLDQKWGIIPGGIFSKTLFDGDETGYWAALAEDAGKIPEWAPNKLATDPLGLNPIPPYAPMWHQLGWMYGGQGIDPPWFDWRECKEGYQRAWREFVATTERNPIAYNLDAYGGARWASIPHYSLQTSAVPPGFGYDLDAAAEWWPGVRDLAEYQRHDGQHLHRAYRAAFVLLNAGDPFAADYLYWLFNHVNMAWGEDSSRDYEPHYFWTSSQIFDHLKENPGPHYRLGREFAHVCRLAWTLMPHSNLAKILEEITRLACSTDAPIPYARVGYHPSARKSNGGPYEDDEPLAETFELMLMALSMKIRPGLQEEYDRMMEWMGTDPPKLVNLAGRFYGDKVPYMHLFFGDLRDKTIDEWLTIASVRKVDAAGSQILNYLPRPFWEDHV